MNEKLKLRNAVYGFAVGDALGVPYESRERGTFKCEGMTGFGTHNQPVGTWSDDTSLVLATCDSILELGTIYVPHVITRFTEFLHLGRYTPFGEVFDVGDQTASGIRFCDQFGTRSAPGKRDVNTNDNGGLMRILPLAFVDDCKPVDVTDVCAITHPHIISEQACIVYVDAMIQTLDGENEIDLDFYGSFKLFKRIKNLKNLTESEIKSTSYVVDTLEAALWCFMTTHNYADCVLKAVNLGGDTDTIAALAGGLAGLKYGFDGIPKEWIEQLQSKELIEMCLF